MGFVRLARRSACCGLALLGAQTPVGLNAVRRLRYCYDYETDRKFIKLCNLLQPSKVQQQMYRLKVQTPQNQLIVFLRSRTSSDNRR